MDADERMLDPLRKAGIEAVIPSKSSRKESRDYDKEMYKNRHLIENFFGKLKQYRAIATRYDKLGKIFLGSIIPGSQCHLAQLTTRPSKTPARFISANAF